MREFQRHGAGFGERGARDAERRALFLFADHDSRRDRPAPRALGNGFLQMRHGRKHELERHALGPQPRQRLAEHRHVVPDLAAPASRQHQQHRRRLVPAFLLLDGGPQARDLLGQGMADIAAGRPAQPAVFLRFERQQRQHVIDIDAHRLRPAGPPCPDRGRDIVDDRDRGIARTHAPRHPVGEVGTVDDDEYVGRGLRDRARPSRGSGRRIFGSCCTTAASPMIDNSSIGNSDVSPSRAIAWPPTPSKRTASPRR